MKSLVRRHSIIVDGHKTSITLEEAFWTASKEIAHERGESLRHLIASINANRQFAHLSSAIRLYVLWYYKDKFARRQAMFEQREISVQKVAKPSQNA
jgi:predicted DNA-binding ribbon-helix-helix protein